MLSPPHDVSGSEPSLPSVSHLDCSVSNRPRPSQAESHEMDLRESCLIRANPAER